MRRFFTKLKAKWEHLKLLLWLYKKIAVYLYDAAMKSGNLVVGIGWVERDKKEDEGKVKTSITYYNMRTYDVYHAFWHMHKRYYDEVEKQRAGMPLQVDDNKGRSYTYAVNIELDEDE